MQSAFASATRRSANGKTAADEVNLNEKFESKAEFDGNGVAVRLAPWEIKTYKIKL